MLSATAERPKTAVNTAIGRTSPAASESAAVQAVAAASGPLTCPAVTAMVAAANAKVALAGPTGWEAILEARNMLVDFTNHAIEAGLTEETALEPALDLADRLDRKIQNSECPARVQIAQALRLNREGFDMSGFMVGLLKDAADEAETAPAGPRSDDPDAVTRWNAVRDAFLAAQAESDRACELEGEVEGLERLKALDARHEPIHRGWRICKETLLATPAPHWAALSLKARTVARHMDGGRWTRAALEFSEVAEEIGTARPADADVLMVMKALGHAEQIAYFAAHRPDGYASYACGLGQVATMASEIEALVAESRELARISPRHAEIIAHIIGAVWFSEAPADGSVDRVGLVEELDEDFSTALRARLVLDGSRDLTAAELEYLQASEDRLDEIRETACGAVPKTRFGVAFQLLVAASLIDRVYGGATDELRAVAGENIRTALANAIRVLGLPFDYRAAEYLLGPQLSDLDGSARPGLAE